MSNILNKDDYTVLSRANLSSDDEVRRVLNENGCANWTVCPECSVDDFVHMEDCSVGIADED